MSTSMDTHDDDTHDDDKEIDYSDCNKLFKYVDYILKVNNDYRTCHKMKVNFFEYMKTYPKVKVIFYNNDNSKIAELEYHEDLHKYKNNDVNFWYTLKYSSKENWRSQKVQKESIIEELNFIRQEIINKYF